MGRTTGGRASTSRLSGESFRPTFYFHRTGIRAPFGFNRRTDFSRIPGTRFHGRSDPPASNRRPPARRRRPLLPGGQGGPFPGHGESQRDGVMAAHGLRHGGPGPAGIPAGTGGLPGGLPRQLRSDRQLALLPGHRRGEYPGSPAGSLGPEARRHTQDPGADPRLPPLLLRRGHGRHRPQRHPRHPGPLLRRFRRVPQPGPHLAHLVDGGHAEPPSSSPCTGSSGPGPTGDGCSAVLDWRRVRPSPSPSSS
jgi:hypothetical protein